MKLNLYMLAFLAFGCSDKENATTNSNTQDKSEETTTETNSESVKSEQKENSVSTETNSNTQNKSEEITTKTNNGENNDQFINDNVPGMRGKR